MARSRRSSLVALLAPLFIAILILPPSKAAAQGAQAWQLVEIVDYDTPPGGGYTLGYSRGAIAWNWTLNDDAWGFVSTWSAPPQTIGPRDRATIEFTVATNQDTGNQYSAGGSFAMFFDRPDIEPGFAGAPISFTNEKGEGGGVDVRHGVKTPAVARRVWVDGARLGTGRPGARVALIVAAYNGRIAGTKYIYEWRAPLTPAELEKLKPPTPPPSSRSTATPAPPPAPPGRPPLEDTGTRFSSIRGSVLVYHEGEDPKQARYAHPNTVLYLLDHVIVEEESSCILGFADLSTHLVNEDSHVVITMPPDKDSKIGLVLGNIWTNVKKMRKDGTMEVEMWDAAASVKGTTFVCETTPSGSTIKVVEGTVEVRSKKRPQSVTLPAGTMVSSTAAGLGPVSAFSVAGESASWDAVRAKTTGSDGVARNLAVGKTATQSSTAYGGVPNRAVDGNTDGRYPATSVTHTGNGLLEWWQVDLGASADIERVAIWNRTDCCAERLASFWLLVSDTPFPAGAAPTGRSTAKTWRRQVGGVAGRTTEVPVGARGRYVRVQLDEPDYLSLAEVQVFGR
jgi:hypothetical protein